MTLFTTGFLLCLQEMHLRSDTYHIRCVVLSLLSCLLSVPVEAGRYHVPGTSGGM